MSSELTAAWSRVAGAKLSKTVKAKKGRKAKVRVRAFKRRGDNTVYSAWSKAKKVKR